MEKMILQQLIDQGMSGREIALATGKSHTTTRYWLKIHSLSTKKTGRNRQGNHICPKCKQEKNSSDFYQTTGKIIGVTSYCKQCNTVYCIERIRIRKVKLINHMGGECADCGLKLKDSHFSVFDFHHIDPSKKEYTGNKLKYGSWDKAIRELNKCVLLCSNCHRIRHHGSII